MTRFERRATSLRGVGGEELRGKIVPHTSGARGADALDALRICGAAVGSMHPLQSFSGVDVPPLEGKIFAIEGYEAAVRAARQLVRALSGTPVRIAAAKKTAVPRGGRVGGWIGTSDGSDWG